MRQNVLSIFQLNEYIRSMMDRDDILGQVAVRGEISNYKKYPSGHHYFTLKDDNAALRCVMFRGNAVTLRFRPENGMKVIAFGKVTAYPRDGVYQLYTTAMVVDGVGDLHVAFEQLKKKLAAEGLFDESHKKTLPRYPKRIGIVTSSAGAAVHDMLKILNRKFPLAEIYLLPVRVQGVEAPGEIAAAIRYANQHCLCDVLITGRGGGSMEDLWAFNDELVAHAIFDSQIPVISAVGHEPDVTISDYVADVRAATPTHAAELAVPDCVMLEQEIDAQFGLLTAAVQKKLADLQNRLDRIASLPVMLGPGAYISQKEKELMYSQTILKERIQKILSTKEYAFSSLCGKLDAMSPLKVLNRGYALVESESGSILSDVSEVEIGQRIQVRFSNGRITADVTNKENDHA